MSSTSSATDADRSALHAALADELYAALRDCRTVSPLSSRGLGLGIDDACRISLGLLERRQAAGERLIDTSGAELAVDGATCAGQYFYGLPGAPY